MSQNKGEHWKKYKFQYHILVLSVVAFPFERDFLFVLFVRWYCSRGALARFILFARQVVKNVFMTAYFCSQQQQKEQ
jgi:hypothetical protein